MKKHAIIPAGGEGRRAGGNLPKQFVGLLGIPMLWRSVEAFHREDAETQITVVVHPGFFDDFDILRSELPAELKDIPLRVVAGGRTRGESVKNGLMGIDANRDTIIAVHDAARPLVTPELIRRGWECAALNGAAVPVVAVTDSLRELREEGSEAVDRSRFVAVQTPQVFRGDILVRAYELDERPEFTDDASRVEAIGEKIMLYPGEAENFKVTNPSDFALAETLLRRRGL